MVEEKELRAIIQMLGATTRMADHLRITHDLDQKSEAGVCQYNSIVKRLKDTDTIPESMFAPLKEDAPFVDLGMCCEQLSAYLKGMVGEPAEGKKHDAPGNIGVVNIGGNLKELGDLIRQAMPAWIREQMEGANQQTLQKKEEEADMNDLESRIAELGAQMQALAERMSREEMSSDEIRKLADQMRELGQQQSELAKKHAAIRAPKDK